MAIRIRDHHLTCNTHNTYDVFFYTDTIVTTVTHDPETVDQWISDIEELNGGHLHHLIVGLDVEGRPSISSGVRNPVATIQLCVGRRCLIYQLIHSSYITPSLTAFLADDLYTFVGVGIKSDLEKLDTDYGVGGETRAMELGTLAAAEYGRPELKSAGLKELARVVLGKEVEKPRRVTTGPWDNRWLTAEQIQYACVDAFVSFEIGRILNASEKMGGYWSMVFDGL